MTTVKEFEEQKQGIIDFVGNNFDTSTKNGGNNFVKIIDLVEGLQPPRPTCSTCEHSTEIVKWGEPELQCCNLGVHPRAANYEFGCIHHSDYGDEK